MALQTYTAGLFTNLGQHLAVSLNQNLDQALADSGLDTLRVQDLHHIIVQADDDDDYQKQMEELQKKLAELEREKAAEKQAAIERAAQAERERQQREEEERRRREAEEKRNQENYFERRWDDIVDDFQHPGNIPANIGKDFEDTVDTLEEDEKEVQEFVRKLPDRSRAIWQKLLVLKWIVNLWTVGVPWCVLLFVIFSWNVYVNIFWNKFWAEGNLFLVGNTVYIILQSLISLPLMFEIPPLLRLLKPFRLLSLASSIVYNVLFFGSVLDFFYLADVEEKDLLEDQGWGDMFVSLLIFYNLVENFPILIINWGIMIKEITLPFFQLISNAHAPSRKDRIQLGLLDIEDAIPYLLKLTNPSYWGILLVQWILGWNPLDMFIENKQDEEHYYAGKVVDEVKEITHLKK